MPCSPVSALTPEYVSKSSISQGGHRGHFDSSSLCRLKDCLTLLLSEPLPYDVQRQQHALAANILVLPVHSTDFSTSQTPCLF